VFAHGALFWEVDQLDEILDTEVGESEDVVVVKAGGLRRYSTAELALSVACCPPSANPAAQARTFRRLEDVDDARSGCSPRQFRLQVIASIVRLRF
jgi:hypothetical protein